MRPLSLWLGCAVLVFAGVRSSEVYTYEDEPSLLEWKLKRSSKKEKDRSNLNNDNGSTAKPKKEKRRGLFRRRGKDTSHRRGTDLEAHQEDLEAEKPKKRFGIFRKKNKAHLREQKSEKKKDRKSRFSRNKRKKQQRDGNEKRERRHRDVTDSLHELIEMDQHEQPSLRGSLTDVVKSASKRVKNRLMQYLSRDIDSAMEELQGAR